MPCPVCQSPGRSTGLARGQTKAYGVRMNLRTLALALTLPACASPTLNPTPDASEPNDAATGRLDAATAKDAAEPDAADASRAYFRCQDWVTFTCFPKSLHEECCAPGQYLQCDAANGWVYAVSACPVDANVPEVCADGCR